MKQVDLTHLCSVVSEAICAVNGVDKLSSPINPESRMGSPAEWDSLSFVSVFNAVEQEFGIELEDDDAIHFTSIGAMYSLLLELQ